MFSYTYKITDDTGANTAEITVKAQREAFAFDKAIKRWKEMRMGCADSIKMVRSTDPKESK